MEKPKMKTTDRIMNKVALPIIVVAGLLVVVALVLDTRGATTENNGYIRVINCVISIPATVRTQKDIEKCYETVESDLGIKLQRYDTSSYNK